MRFRQTCRAAKADGTLRAIARAIVAANRSGTPDAVAYCAFRDRAEEIGLTVPNPAYWKILLWSVIRAN